MDSKNNYAPGQRFRLTAPAFQNRNGRAPGSARGEWANRENFLVVLAHSRRSETSLFLPKFASVASARRLADLGSQTSASHQPRFPPVWPNHRRARLVLPWPRPNHPGATLFSPRFVQIRPARRSRRADWDQSRSTNRRFTPVGRNFCRLAQKPSKNVQIYEKTPRSRTVNLPPLIIMASNILLSGLQDLFPLAEDMADGLYAHEAGQAQPSVTAEIVGP